MAKKIKNTNDEKDVQEENSEDVVVDSELTVEEDEENTDAPDVSEIPIEEFMKDPERLSKYTDEADVEETTSYCPQCSDYTIFVNNVCTGCGFTKGSRKANAKDDDEEESVGFELPVEDEIINELGYEYNENDESYD